MGSTLAHTVSANSTTLREVRAFYALNVGERIDLAKCRALLEEAGSPEFVLVEQQSVRFRSGVHPLSVVECEAFVPQLSVEALTPDNSARLTLYELGLCSVEFRIASKRTLEETLSVSLALWQNSELAEIARNLSERLARLVKNSIQHPELSLEAEDYIVYLGEPQWPAEQEGLEWLALNGAVVARILNSEPGQLSRQEQAISLSTAVSYGSRDLAVLDWAAGLVLASDAKLKADVLEVIEFANAILLNLRELDAQLKHITDQLAEERGETFGSWFMRQLFGSMGKFLNVGRTLWRFRRILNRLDNPLDLVGDTHLERIYRELASGLRVKSYRSSIEESLASLGDYRDRLREQSRHIVTRNLELIIVALFLYEILWQ